jgi:hypothetical protein
MENHSHDHPDVEQPLSFEEKMAKLVAHWIRHNDDHAENYRKWAKKAKQHQLPETGDLLEKAAEMTDLISHKFKAAADSMPKKP